MRNRNFTIMLVLLLMLIAVSGAVAFDLPPLVVNSANDMDDGTCDGTHCSLREAINAANADPDTTTIAFNIPGGGVHTIQPASALPIISAPVILDGATQPGYSGVPLIDVDGVDAGPAANGLVITGGNSTLKGLIVSGFSVQGIILFMGGNNVLVANYVGTNSSGTSAHGNRDGVYLFESANNIVGGTTPADRNIISGNNDDGVNFAGAGAVDNIVQGNYIGTDVTGTLPIGNAGDGVKISETSNDNVVGGTTPGSGNVIAFNNGRGVYSENVTTFATGNRILGNSIFSNNQLGIDLKGDGITANDAGDADSGPNNLQNFPLLTSATFNGSTTTLAGTLNSRPGRSYRLEFFANQTCDASGNGEGEVYLGSINVTTNASGNASFNTAIRSYITLGHQIAATATDSANNTSEFSPCVTFQSSASAVPVPGYYTTLTPTLTWNRVSGATGYQIQVADNKTFSGTLIVDDATLSADELSKVITVPANGVYYWRVRAKQASGVWNPTWSATQPFIVET